MFGNSNRMFINSNLGIGAGFRDTSIASSTEASAMIAAAPRKDANGLVSMRS
jgi:hypothetical protein